MEVKTFMTLSKITEDSLGSKKMIVVSLWRWNA